MAVSKDDNLHVAVLASPGMGHIIPLFQLAKALVTNHGIHVSFLVITAGASAAQNQFLHSPRQDNNNFPADLLRIVDIPQVDLSTIVSDDMLLMTRISVTIQASLGNLLPILTDLKPNALVVDLFTTQVIDFAREFSIPVHAFFTGSAAFLAFSLYLPTLDREFDGEFIDLPEPIKIPGCRSERPEDLLDQVRNRKIDEYKWFLFHMSRLKLADGIFENSWNVLEPSTVKALKEHPFYMKESVPVYPVGPMIKCHEDIVTKKDADIMAWLDSQPAGSVLFVAFGSGGTLSSEQLTELAWGLEMSQQRFILVARKPSDGSASAAFFTVGNDVVEKSGDYYYLPEGFGKRTERVGLVVPEWAPQAAILGHVSTGGFLSHCGWNSTLESLANGVPILAWPLYAEQRMNATLLAEEVGVAVKPATEPGKKIIRRKEIERVVRLLMEGEEGEKMRRKATELKESAAKAVSHGGSSYNSLAAVVDFWKSVRTP